MHSEEFRILWGGTEIVQDPRYLKNEPIPEIWEEDAEGNKGEVKVWKQPDQPYRYNPGMMELDGGTRSLRLVDKFVDLTEAEAQAILAHDGQYVLANKQYAQKETPLLLMLHFADMYCGRVVEGNIGPDWKMDGVFQVTE